MRRSDVRLRHRIGPEGPHRILALDGGGVRGMITLEFLDAIEHLLRQRYNNPNYVLADYYDLIGGTSAGSLVATMLARGWPMARVRQTFETWAPKIFAHRIGLGVFRPRFSERELNRCLKQEVGDLTIDTAELKTGLAIICKRVDTGSPWVVTNNPKSRFWRADKQGYEHDEADWIDNREYRIADLVRASTAAPTYFHPKTIPIYRRGRPGTFVDGGVSPYNSPALLLFMMSGVKGYGFNWTPGASRLLLTSIGTGSFRVMIEPNWLTKRVPLVFAAKSLLGVVGDAQSLNLKLMQWLSEPRNCWTINSEVDDLRDEGLFKLIGHSEPLLTFSRYDIKLEASWLRDKMGMTDLTDRDLRRLQALDDVSQVPLFKSFGRRAAAHQVSDADFPPAFDRPAFGAG